ncbi:MAG TPA: CsgG/HfaB family protein [Pyrinomonadaceae bacterium]|nr:CsgG/HfaB family protein [Pyrinomonadaceae bacterium]
MKKIVTLLVLLIVLTASVIHATSASQEKSDKPRIAVLEFTTPFTASDVDKKDVSLSTQNMLNAELARTGKFRIVEREQLVGTLNFWRLPVSGEIDPATAVRIGKQLSAKYVATGAVTEYGVTDKGAHGHGAAPFAIAIKMTLINVATGEIAWSGEERQMGPRDRVMKPCIQKLTASLKAADL